MNGPRSLVRSARDTLFRRGLSLGLVVIVLTSLLGPSIPAQASGLPPQKRADVAQLQGGDPAARLQVIIKAIHVANDREGALSGAGEMSLKAIFFRCIGTEAPCSGGFSQPAERLAEWNHNFGASSGDTKVLDHVLPGAADVKNGMMASEAAGISVRAGERYVFQVSMWENDPGADDFMGGIQRVVEESNGWGVGLHSLEAAGEMPDKSLPTVDFICAGCSGIILGDYLVTYEIRKTPLPDLRPTAIRVNGPGVGGAGVGQENVCLRVVNDSHVDAGPFLMHLYVDNTLAPNGAVAVGGLTAGAPYDGCTNTNLPTSEFHQMRLVVDQGRLLAEQNEHNNALVQGLDRTPAGTVKAPSGGVLANGGGAGSPATGSPNQNPAPAPAPNPAPVIVTPTATPTKAPATTAPDLLVSAVRVNGQAPDGKDDCKDGKNTVTVVVKNGGAAKAGGFVVRLDVDGERVADEDVSGLDAGKEQEIRFGGVRLKKGGRSLTAVIDAQGAVAESNEENNDRKVSAQCKDED